MFSFASRLENGEANIDLGQTTWRNLRQKSSRLSKTLQVGYQLELGFLGLNQFNILKTTWFLFSCCCCFVFFWNNFCSNICMVQMA